MPPKGLLSSLALAAIVVACGRPPAAATPTSTQQIGDDHSASTTPDGSSIDPYAVWLSYTHETGVSISYPPSWSPELTADSALFVSPEGSRILWEIFPRPLSERALADPNVWVPNEGGYEIHWSRSVTIPAAEGLEFIWGVYQGNSWGVAPQLMAVLYSEERELDIRLSTFFDIDSIEALDELGPERAISTHFAVFEHMLRTIQIATD